MGRMKRIQKIVPMTIGILMVLLLTGCSFSKSDGDKSARSVHEAEEKGLEMLEEEGILDSSQGFFIMDLGEPILMSVDFEYFPDGVVKIPDTVTQIYNTAFQRSELLTSIIIPDSVTGFDLSGEVSGGMLGAFGGCTNLESVVIGNGLTEIPDGMFAQCTSLKEVSIPESVEHIGWGAFYGCDSLSDEAKQRISSYTDSSDLLFHQLSIPLIFENEYDMDNILATFGPPAGSDTEVSDHYFYSYDDITFSYSGPSTSGQITEILISDLSQCEVNGETLNKNRAGLDPILGTPLEEYQTEDNGYEAIYSWAGFNSQVSLYADLILCITAPSPDDIATSIRIFVN